VRSRTGERCIPTLRFEANPSSPKWLRNRPRIPFRAVRSRSRGARGHPLGTQPGRRVSDAGSRRRAREDCRRALIEDTFFEVKQCHGDSSRRGPATTSWDARSHPLLAARRRASGCGVRRAACTASRPISASSRSPASCGARLPLRATRFLGEGVGSHLVAFALEGTRIRSATCSRVRRRSGSWRSRAVRLREADQRSARAASGSPVAQRGHLLKGVPFDWVASPTCHMMIPARMGVSLAAALYSDQSVVPILRSHHLW
jgi:hypothetical protein